MDNAELPTYLQHFRFVVILNFLRICILCCRPTVNAKQQYSVVQHITGTMPHAPPMHDPCNNQCTVVCCIFIRKTNIINYFFVRHQISQPSCLQEIPQSDLTQPRGNSATLYYCCKKQLRTVSSCSKLYWLKLKPVK